MKIILCNQTWYGNYYIQAMISFLHFLEVNFRASKQKYKITIGKEYIIQSKQRRFLGGIFINLCKQYGIETESKRVLPIKRVEQLSPF